MAPKKFPRSQIKALAEQLGHNPEHVLEIAIKHTVVVVTSLQLGRDGNVSMGVFGPNTWDSYHAVDEDDQPDVDKPTPHAPGS